MSSGFFNDIKQDLTPCSSIEERSVKLQLLEVQQSTCGDLPLGQRLEMRGCGDLPRNKTTVNSR